MKYFLSLISLSIFPFIAFSQVSFEKQAEFGGTQTEYYKAAVYDEETGESYHFGGSNSDGSTGNKSAQRYGSQRVYFDYWLCKLDKEGNIIWDKSFGGLSGEKPMHILKHKSSLYLLGYSGSPVSGNKTAPKLNANPGLEKGVDIWIVKVDLDGNIIWDKTYGGPGSETVHDGIITSAGNLLLAGSSNSSAAGDVTDSNVFGVTNCWLVNLDTNGNIIWERSLQTDQNAGFSSVVQDDDGNFLTVSTTKAGKAGDKTIENNGKGTDLWVVKFDSLGNVYSQNVLGTKLFEENAKVYFAKNSYYLTTTTNGGVSGDKESEAIGTSDLWILKLDKELNLVWQKSLGSNGHTGYLGTNRIKFFNEDELIVLTTTVASTGMGSWGNTIGYGDDDYLLFSLKDEGDFNWAIQFGGSRIDRAHDFYVDSDGQIVVCGQSISPASGMKVTEGWGTEGYNFWLVWLDTPVFTEEIEEPENLVTLYPNPAVHALHFEAGSDYKGYQIISLSGAVVNAGRVEQGQNTIDVTALPVGMYVIKLEGEGISFTKKWVKGR